MASVPADFYTYISASGAARGGLREERDVKINCANVMYSRKQSEKSVRLLRLVSTNISLHYNVHFFAVMRV